MYTLHPFVSFVIVVFRGEGESHVDFKAMIICLALHLLLVMFEIFVCINLGGGQHFPWRLMFMPLYVLSSLSIIACIWGFRHDRSVEVCSSSKMQKLLPYAYLTKHVWLRWLGIGQVLFSPAFIDQDEVMVNKNAK